MSRAEVLRLLKWLIDVNGTKRGNEIALKKWVEDYDYVSGFTRNRMRITQVLHSKHNHFTILE